MKLAQKTKVRDNSVMTVGKLGGEDVFTQASFAEGQALKSRLGLAVHQTTHAAVTRNRKFTETNSIVNHRNRILCQETYVFIT